MSAQLTAKFHAKVLLFALSTCVMCRRVKKLLTEMNVEYEFVDVDLLSRDEKKFAKDVMRKWDPRCPFPMLIINDSTCVVGDEPDRIRTALHA